MANEIGEGLVTIVEGVANYMVGRRNARLAREDAERIAREAIAREEAARRQQQQWLEMVQRQMSQGSAGDAEEDEAIDSLSGRGGRKSELDEEWF